MKIEWNRIRIRIRILLPKGIGLRYDYVMFKFKLS